jgi:hypothetical protein
MCSFSPTTCWVHHHVRNVIRCTFLNVLLMWGAVFPTSWWCHAVQDVCHQDHSRQSEICFHWVWTVAGFAHCAYAQLPEYLYLASSLDCAVTFAARSSGPTGTTVHWSEYFCLGWTWALPTYSHLYSLCQTALPHWNWSHRKALELITDALAMASREPTTPLALMWWQYDTNN